MASATHDKRRRLARLLHEAGIDHRFGPLTRAQHSIWTAQRHWPENPFYTIAVALDIAGPLSIDALQAALDALVNRHDALRSCIVALGDQPVALVSPGGSLPLAYRDLRTLQRADREAEALASARAHALVAFDLASAPLARAELLQIDDDRAVLNLALHHLIADEWSMDLLLRELLHLYDCFRTGRPPSLAPAASFAAVCRRERAAVAATSRHELLAGAQAMLRAQDPRVAADGGLTAGPFDMATETLRLPASVTNDLAKACVSLHAPPFAPLLAAAHVALAGLTGQPRLRLASLAANRWRDEDQAVVGLMVSTIVVPVDLEGDPSFLHVAAQVRDSLLQAASTGGLPFETLVDALAAEGRIDPAAFCPVLCVYQARQPRTFTLDGLRIRPFAHATEDEASRQVPTSFQVVIVLTQDDEGVTVSCLYRRSLSHATIASFLARYRSTVLAAADAPSQPVSRFGVVTAAAS